MYTCIYSIHNMQEKAHVLLSLRVLLNGDRLRVGTEDAQGTPTQSHVSPSIL